MLSRLQLAGRTVINLGRNISVIYPSRHFSTKYWNQYSAGVVKIEDVLIKGKSAYPALFTTPKTNISALQYAVQPLSDLQLMHQCFGRYKGCNGHSVTDLILYHSDRRSLQMTGALSSILIRTPPKNSEFATFIQELHKKYVLPQLPEIDMSIKRAQYFSFMQKTLNDDSTRAQYPQIHNEFDTYIAEGKTRKDQGIIQLSDAEIRELAIKLIADRHLQKETDKLLHDRVEAKIEQLTSSGTLKSLFLIEPMDAQTFIGMPEPAQATYPHRFTTMLAGGPGSGKSISAETFALQLKEMVDIDLEDIAILNVDRMRTIFDHDECVIDAPKINVGTLAHDEAVVTFNMTREFILQRIAQKKKVPHCLQEMCNIWPEWIDLALKSDGQFIATISTRNAEKAVEGVIARGVEQNEAVTPPEYVLWSYKSVSERFPYVIQESQSKRMNLVIINNEQAIERKFNPLTRHEPMASKPAAVVDCESNTIYIVDLQQYLDFLNQSQINVAAVSADEVYKGADLSIKSSISRAIDPKRFGSAKIAFVRPDVDSTSITSLEKQVVATVQDTQLEIVDAEQFDLLKQTLPQQMTALEEQTCYIRSLEL